MPMKIKRLRERLNVRQIEKHRRKVARRKPRRVLVENEMGRLFRLVFGVAESKGKA